MNHVTAMLIQKAAAQREGAILWHTVNALTAALQREDLIYVTCDQLDAAQRGKLTMPDWWQAYLVPRILLPHVYVRRKP